MAIEQKTVIDQIEIRRDGTIQIRLALLLVDGEQELARQWHRTAVEPGASVDAQLAVVNTHLQAMGKAQLDDSGTDKLKQIAQLVHTQEVVQKHVERKAR